MVAAGASGTGVGISALAFSPDGGILAYRGKGNSIHIWSVAAAREIGAFTGHEGSIAALAFTPDGKRLVTGSRDATMLLWDVASVRRAMQPATGDLQAKELADLWSDLLQEDAGKAFRSIRTLATASKQAVPFLRDRVKPAVPADPKKLERLIADLDSEKFDVRAGAIAGLEKLGELAEPALEKARTGEATLENAPTHRRFAGPPDRRPADSRANPPGACRGSARTVRHTRGTAATRFARPGRSRRLVTQHARRRSIAAKGRRSRDARGSRSAPGTGYLHRRQP